MKNKSVKTIVGASIFAASLASNAQTESKKIETNTDADVVKSLELKIGDFNLLDSLFIKDIAKSPVTKEHPKTVNVKGNKKSVVIKDITEQLESMVDGAKTENVERIGE